MNNRVIGKNNNIPNYNEISFLFYNISNVLYSLLILIATIPKKKKDDNCYTTNVPIHYPNNNKTKN